jgi:phosphoglycerate dehydrogenase-like enzyme
MNSEARSSGNLGISGYGKIVNACFAVIEVWRRSVVFVDRLLSHQKVAYCLIAKVSTLSSKKSMTVG